MGLLTTLLGAPGGERYNGAWAASTNTPSLADGVGAIGDFYIAYDGGSVDFGSGSITFTSGDTVIYNGTIWQKIEGGVSYTPLNKAGDTMTGTLTSAVTALTSTSNAIAVDASNGNTFTHTLTENTTVGAPTNLINGTVYNFIFIQHASMAKTLAFNSAFLFPDGVDPIITTTLSGVMMVSCLYTSAGGLCCVFAQNFS